jgi:hypothetical protein
LIKLGNSALLSFKRIFADPFPLEILGVDEEANASEFAMVVKLFHSSNLSGFSRLQKAPCHGR